MAMNKAMASTTAPVPEVDFDAMPTLGDITRHHTYRKPDSIAMVCEGRTTTWAALDCASNQVANALVTEGIAPSDRVAFIGKGGDLFFELMFGVAKAGAVLIPIQWRLALPEMVEIVRDARPRLLVIGADQHDRFADLCAGLGGDLPPIVAMEGDLPGQRRYETWRGEAPASDPGLAVDAASVALQLYTSGTTGTAKGVMLSHANLLSGRRMAMDAPMPWNEWIEGDVNLTALPVGHIGGVGWAIVGFFNGATTIVQREFHPDAVLSAIEHAGVTKMFFVPTALQMLLLHPRVREIDYSRLRYVLYGASPIALDLLREATEVFGCGFCQQYGMTETTGTIVYLPPEDHDPAGTPRMRAAGLPMPGVEIRVVDPDSRASLPPHSVGEVETRSVANMVGYWGQPEATAQTVASDGWLRTGDAGYLDEDGYLYIHDRFKDMICSGAENVYPAEVESALYGHPAVQEVAVFGIPDDKWGESVKAVVVARPGATPDADSIIAHARERLAAFKVPRSIDFIEALPRSASGKILRRVLRDPYWEGRERRVN